MANDTFLRACRGEPVEHTPIWLMRQAGRYLKEYMEIRKKSSFLEMCKTPEIACEVTLQPLRRFELDAAIIFADILLPLEGMGVNFHFAKNEGPVIDKPIRENSQIDAIKIIEPERDVPYVLEAIRLTRAELKGKVPLLGFCGAPFTLASYMIEGGGSKNYLKTKRLMFSDPGAWKVLMEKVSEVLSVYLRAQIEAGAQAVQIFDSWVGCLGAGDYEEYVLPYTKKVIDSVGGDVPVINFSTNTGPYIDLVAKAGGDVVSVDWRIGLDTAWERIGTDRAIQGNLDPGVLFGPAEYIRKRAKEVLDRAGGRPGHIFNLGHGIILGTPVDSVAILVDSVHELSRR